MSLHDELGFFKPIKHKGHETLLNIIVTANLLIKEAQQLFRPYGLTDAQFDVLMILETQSEKGLLNQTELGRMLLVNRSNVTGLVDRMEQAGWVKRTPDGEDRRINLVGITDNGRKILSSTKDLYIQRIEKVTSVLSDDEKKLLIDILEKIRKHI
jgi:DNA-binding MarR family transcriptional regulator